MSFQKSNCSIVARNKKKDGNLRKKASHEPAKEQKREEFFEAKTLKVKTKSSDTMDAIQRLNAQLNNPLTRTSRLTNTPSPMWLLEACVAPSTASSHKWLTEFLPVATHLILAGRPAFIIVRNSWNPTPFDHYPSKPATCVLTITGNDNVYVSTDANVWTQQEIRSTVEDCDFVSGNMWFYIPYGEPRSSDELFENVIDPLLAWNRSPTGEGEVIGSAEDALALLYWNGLKDVLDVSAKKMEKLAAHIGITIENQKTMIINCLDVDFSVNATLTSDADKNQRQIPLFDMFWFGIALIILQSLYLLSKLQVFRDWLF